MRLVALLIVVVMVPAVVQSAAWIAQPSREAVRETMARGKMMLLTHDTVYDQNYIPQPHNAMTIILEEIASAEGLTRFGGLMATNAVRGGSIPYRVYGVFDPELPASWYIVVACTNSWEKLASARLRKVGEALRQYIDLRAEGHTAAYAWAAVSTSSSAQANAGYPKGVPPGRATQDARTGLWFVVDGDLCWVYLMTGPQRRDAKEADPKWAPIIQHVKDEVKASRSGVTSASQQVEEVKRILERRYAIKWQSVVDLNPLSLVMAPGQAPGLSLETVIGSTQGIILLPPPK